MSSRKISLIQSGENSTSDAYFFQGGITLVVVALVGRLGEQADGLLAYGLGHGHEAAGFKNVVHGAPGAAVGSGRGAFPGEGVAVPAVEGEAAAQFALFARLFVAVPLRAGFGAVSVVGVGAFA